MEFKDYVAITLSVLAFGLGLFNLWWGTFRKRVALYYLQMGPKAYVLVNGGKTDVLVTEVAQYFQGANTGTRMKLGDTGISEETPTLLKAGQASQHRITGQEEYPTQALFNYAKQQENGSRRCSVVMTVAWIDIDSHRHYAEFETGAYAILPNALGAWWLTGDQIDLTDPKYPVTRRRSPPSKWSAIRKKFSGTKTN